VACGVGFLSHSARRRTATYPTWTNRESAATPRLLHDRFVDVVYRSGVDNESQQQQQLTISDQQLVRHSMLNSEKQRFVDCGPRYSHTTPRTARARDFFVLPPPKLPPPVFWDLSYKLPVRRERLDVRIKAVYCHCRPIILCVNTPAASNARQLLGYFFIWNKSKGQILATNIQYKS